MVHLAPEDGQPHPLQTAHNSNPTIYGLRHFRELLQPLNGLFSRTTWISRYQKGKTNLDFTEQETVSGSGISWAVCKSAPRSRQTTMPVPTTLFFTGRMPFLPANQQHQSTEGTSEKDNKN